MYKTKSGKLPLPDAAVFKFFTNLKLNSTAELICAISYSTKKALTKVKTSYKNASALNERYLEVNRGGILAEEKCGEDEWTRTTDPLHVKQIL